MAQISEQNGIVFRKKYMKNLQKKKYIFVRKLKKISNSAHFENIIIAQKYTLKNGRVGRASFSQVFPFKN